ncbi:MAG: hypothetical protein JWL90_3887 [Chthoniobacteraceae bacterium]|nr:hypothetical protein [Chthoniobacteraceae bacterium]
MSPQPPPTPFEAFLTKWRQALGVFALTAGLIAFILIVVWFWKASVFTPRLLLIGLVFGGLIVALIKFSTTWGRSLRDRKLPDAMSRTEALVVGTVFAVVVVGGCMVEVAAISGSGTNGFHEGCTGLIASLAALISGALVGFLFGIPRAIGGDGSSFNENWELKPGKGSAAGTRMRFETNSNLTLISDWLTKMLVGVLLVEWRGALNLFQQAAHAVAAGLRSSSTPEVVSASFAAAASILVFFGIAGFLSGYMMTRMFLAGAFIRADTASDLLSVSHSTLRDIPLGEWDLKSEPTPAFLRLADEVTIIPMSELKSWQELDTWGKAQLVLGKTDKALEAYVAALALEPRDAGLRFNYAVALSKQITYWQKPMSEWPEGDKTLLERFISALRDARDRLQETDCAEVRKNIYKALSYANLFRPAPVGFEQALEAGESYAKNPRSLPSGGIYVNNACGYGQWTVWLLENAGIPLTDDETLKLLWITGETRSRIPEALRPKAEELSATLSKITGKSSAGETLPILELRNKVLASIQSAIKLDSNWKTKVQQLMEMGSASTAVTDDDLAIFRYDKEIREAAGLLPIKLSDPAPPSAIPASA